MKVTEKKYDAIVIGAGIIGNSIGYELAQNRVKSIRYKNG